MKTGTTHWVLTKYGCTMLMAALLLAVYFIVGHHVRAYNGLHLLSLPLDAAIPFVPITVWFYLTGLIGSTLLSVILIQDATVFRAAAHSLIIASALNFAFFVVIPISYPRPPIDPLGNLVAPVPYALGLVPGDPLSPMVMSWLYSFDPASCTYPSFHVTVPVAFALAFRFQSRGASLTLAFIAVMVLVTTWTTKQHFFVDGFAGALSAWLGHRVAFRRLRSMRAPWSPSATWPT